MKKILLVIPVCLTLVAGIWAFAAGDLQDPLVSLSQLTNVFTAMVESKVEEKLDQSDAQLREAAATGEPLTQIASYWTEKRLKEDDLLTASLGTNVLVLAGGVQVEYTGAADAVVDVTSGQAVASGTNLTVNHRYLVAEECPVTFSVTSKTAVVNYQGPYGFAFSQAVDYNAIASALKVLHLFKGAPTGYGEGFDLEVAPTRLQALIMFIRVMGEEEQALSWSGTTPFVDVEKGSEAERYVGYAYSKGYTNGYTAEEFRPAGKVNAYQYTEFMLRALGYSSASHTNLADTLILAQEAGLLSGQKAEQLAKETFLRADLVYVSYCALDTILPDGTRTLGDQLLEKGIFTAEERYQARQMVSEIQW